MKKISRVSTIISAIMLLTYIIVLISIRAGFLIQYRHILMQQEWQIVMEAKETLHLNQFLPRFYCYSSH